MQNLEALREKLRTEFIRQRTERGWTQSELSRRAKLAGLPFHQSTIGKIETGKRSLDAAEAMALANVLGMDLGAVVASTADLEGRLRSEIERFQGAETKLLEAGHEYFSSFAALVSAFSSATNAADALPESDIVAAAREETERGFEVTEKLERFGEDAWGFDLRHGHDLHTSDDVEG